MVAESQQLQVKARQCRELADTAMTEEARVILREIAHKYEVEASEAAAIVARRKPAEAIA